jgi:hypothetical protein
MSLENTTSTNNNTNSQRLIKFKTLDNNVTELSVNPDVNKINLIFNYN